MLSTLRLVWLIRWNQLKPNTSESRNVITADHTGQKHFDFFRLFNANSSKTHPVIQLFSKSTFHKLHAKKQIKIPNQKVSQLVHAARKILVIQMLLAT